MKRWSARRRQQGSILIFAVLAISIGVILLSVADIGMLYWYKRDFQKAADLAALAGASKLVNDDGSRSCDNNAKPAATTNASQNLGSRSYTLTVTCGVWSPSASQRFTASASDTDIDQNAVQAQVSGTPPRFLPYVPITTITAHATAMVNAPQAQLKIRTTTATLDDGAVNALLSALLGGNASLSVLGWQGVADADINLLDFLNGLLGVNANVDIGSYQSLLDTTVSVGQILDAEITALNNASQTTAAATVGLFEQQLGAVGVDVGTLDVPLGDLLELQTGAQTAGLNAVVNAFDLLNAVVQAANGANAISADVPISIPGVAGVTIRASVVEPPQPSAIGNPALIDPTYPGDASTPRIYVRTGQVRALVATDLQVIGLVNGLTNILYPLVGVQLLNDQLDVALQVGGAQAYVTGYSCGTDGYKELDVHATTSLAQATIGELTTTQENDVFSSTADFPSAGPLNILKLTLLGITVAEVQLQASDVPVAATSSDLTYTATTDSPNGLPEIGTETDQMYRELSSQDIVASLADTIGSLRLNVVVLNSGLLGAILNGLLSSVAALVQSVLAPILDPVLNGLLTALGLNLDDAEVGAALSCNGTGAVLVN
nr:TadG family pilus assembly protein [Solimonas marina]